MEKLINRTYECRIQEEILWRSDDVRNFCIKHEFYTKGDNKSFLQMLDFVDKKLPTLENQYKVAQNIFWNSDCGDLEIETIMYMMNSENVIHRFYNMKETEKESPYCDHEIDWLNA